MSIIAELGWVALTFFVGSVVTVIAIVISAVAELMRMAKYAWFKLVLLCANWLKLKNVYLDELDDIVTKITDADADKAAKFREWEFAQWKKS